MEVPIYSSNLDNATNILLMFYEILNSKYSIKKILIHNKNPKFKKNDIIFLISNNLKKTETFENDVEIKAVDEHHSLISEENDTMYVKLMNYNPALAKDFIQN